MGLSATLCGWEAWGWVLLSCHRKGRGLEAGLFQGKGGWDSTAPSHPPCLVALLPPPRLRVDRGFGSVLRPGKRGSLVCYAPLSGVDFQLRRGEKELFVPMSSTSPDRVFFQLDTLVPADSGLYTCRYRLREEHTPWSRDSAPVELLLSDGEPGAVP